MQRVSTIVVGVFAVILGGCGSHSASEDAPARCGDGRVELGEECDGTDLAGRSCASFRRTGGGALACRADCTFDFTSCHDSACGNGRIDGATDTGLGFCEQCDGDALGDHSCAGFGGSGSLRCTESCAVDRAACDHLCANGRLEPGEPCEIDPATGATIVPEGVSCESLGLGHGTLDCFLEPLNIATASGTAVFDHCALATYGCELGAGQPTCGDGVKQVGEPCDGSDFGGLSCDQLGLTGSLRCDPDCLLDLSDCILPPGPAVCGNGVVEAGEECDGARLVPVASDSVGRELLSCLRYAAFQGIDVCNSECHVDRARCLSPILPEQCGNAVAEGSEECDGDDLRGMTCADLGGTGTLRCLLNCRLDRTGCSGVAGNGRREGDEPCDALTGTTTSEGTSAADLGGASCESLGYGVGTLGCYTPRRSSQSSAFEPVDPVLIARFLTLACSERGTCGDGRATDGEQCDGDDLGGATCATFDGEGELRCNPGCTFDLTQCRSEARCGDGRISFGEQCEPGNVRASCVDDGGVGEYTCDPDFCFIDRTGCTFTCPADLASAS